MSEGAARSLDESEESPPFLERFAVTYFRRRAATRPESGSSDRARRLTAGDQSALVRVERRAIVVAFLIGAASAAIAGAFETFALPAMGIFEGGELEQTAIYWAWLGSFTGIAAVAEVAFLYWIALSSVHELARRAGVRLFTDPKQEQAEVTRALARAALELPNSAITLLGVDPRREIIAWRLVVATLAYKAKVGVTNFLMKAVVRRAMGRAAIRSWLAFVAVPVTGGWNAWVIWRVMREARIRVVGPSAVAEIVETLIPDGLELSAEARHHVLSAVGASIVRAKDMHPNLECLLRRVQERVEIPGDDALGEPDGFIERFRKLEAADRELALRMLQAACVVNGKLSRGQRSLIEAAQRAAGVGVSLDEVRALRRAFVAGRELTVELVPGTAPRP